MDSPIVGAADAADIRQTARHMTTEGPSTEPGPIGPIAYP